MAAQKRFGGKCEEEVVRRVADVNGCGQVWGQCGGEVRGRWENNNTMHRDGDVIG